MNRMKIPIYQVDAFTSQVFSGNPAAVCLLEEWPGDALLQSIAAENNLSETAFLVANGEDWDIRWFTPVTEVALCGHATLASAYVLFRRPGRPRNRIRFHTRQSGMLAVSRREDLLEMDFPARPASETAPPDGLTQALGSVPRKVFRSAEDLLVLYENESAIRELKPDFFRLEQVSCRGIIVTAPGERSDFVSRFFAPRAGIPEDPVTGSAHCVLIPYWSDLLGKKELYALQISRRGGELYCAHAGERVLISGRAVLYLEGTLSISLPWDQH